VPARDRARVARRGIRRRQGALATAGLRRPIHAGQAEGGRIRLEGAAAGTDQRRVRADARWQGDSFGHPLRRHRSGMKDERQRRTAWIVAAALAPLILSLCGGATAQQTSPKRKLRSLPTIVVTATRIPEPAFDVPASITAVQAGNPDDDTPGVNASEYLRGVPGVLARDRQNYAQDEQISIRGFGARATFGVRGVRLYTDGIPATMPDGQGQVSNFDFGGADRIEVLRGPFSALYGNSSGGVIQIFTADGSDPRSTSIR